MLALWHNTNKAAQWDSLCCYASLTACGLEEDRVEQTWMMHKMDEIKVHLSKMKQLLCAVCQCYMNGVSLLVLTHSTLEEHEKCKKIKL